MGALVLDILRRSGRTALLRGSPLKQIIRPLKGKVVGRPTARYCYGATKAGVIALTRHAAIAYAGSEIRINAIALGLHDTRPVGFGLTEEQVEGLKAAVSKSIPMGRFGEPRQIKGLAVYLASDASSFVTGQVFVEDGGMLA
jgi:NAD(P)-dependent dehydrogenase (short-subunit alcohol dehydrogenase family)